MRLMIYLWDKNQEIDELVYSHYKIRRLCKMQLTDSGLRKTAFIYIFSDASWIQTESIYEQIVSCCIQNILFALPGIQPNLKEITI